MEEYNTQTAFSRQDLSQLLQRGRSSHDQAMYDFFAALTKRVRRLFAKENSVPEEKYQAQQRHSFGG